MGGVNSIKMSSLFADELSQCRSQVQSHKEKKEKEAKEKEKVRNANLEMNQEAQKVIDAVEIQMKSIGKPRNYTHVQATNLEKVNKATNSQYQTHINAITTYLETESKEMEIYFNQPTLNHSSKYVLLTLGFSSKLSEVIGTLQKLEEASSQILELSTGESCRTQTNLLLMIERLDETFRQSRVLFSDIIDRELEQAAEEQQMREEELLDQFDVIQQVN
jgi:hypothetical protein